LQALAREGEEQFADFSSFRHEMLNG
jgi:hypothetical protein